MLKQNLIIYQELLKKSVNEKFPKIATNEVAYKSGAIRRHSNAIKPQLKEATKRSRLEYEFIGELR
jgi:hypothetical protein